MNIIEVLAVPVADIVNGTIEENISLFEEIYNGFIQREGNEKLFDYVKKSDFYSAPASTRFHSSYEGGLLKHSLLVMWCLLQKRKNVVWGESLKDCSDETLILVSLFHDLCKTYFYKSTWKNVKVYSENGSKQDAGGRFDWETVQGYECEDKYPIGHGEKSTYFLMQFMKLNTEEYAAIRWHMGYTEAKDNYIALGNAIEKYPLVLALHEADLEASHIYEVEKK